MAYKKLIKVSNVCQLLDKRKFLATQTINGVTFTNNGDGTITVNGTATGRTVFRFVFDRVIISKGAKLRFNNALDVEAYNKFWVEVKLQYTDGTDKYIADVSITPSPPIKDVNEITGYIIVNDGETVNETLTPQLFDLTEMYGAGHEPTTVEQFRQDFPEEMYDYSPHCWLTSYKRVIVTGDGNYLTTYQRNLTCKTKNLLNPNTCDIFQSVAYGLNIKLIDNNQTVHIYGTSTVTTGSASFNVIKTSDKSIYNKGYKIKIFNLAGKNPPVFKDIYGLRKTDTVGQIAIMIEITKGVYYDFSFKIMVSEQTATDYVPYGHL